MKKIFLMAALLIFVFPFPALSQSEDYYSGSYTRLSYVQGDVYVQRAQNLGTEKGEVNLVIIAGDKLGTREGRAEIQLGRGNYLRLDRNTVVDLVNLPARDGDLTKLHLLSGSVYLRVNYLDREKNFEIHSADASFYVLKEGLFRIDIVDSRETLFSADSGSAEVAGEQGSVLVRDGEQVAAANGSFTSSPVALQSRGDDFSNWNAGREALFAQKQTRTYLPAEYNDYESELSSYGRWSYESPYGYVWVPTVSYYDWRPYYYGRWAWYPIIGWTWISYEPWGWCTSHYGRWGWRFGLGWYWIPHHHWSWGPAWVHWYHDYDYIGWCPLSYYDRPAVLIGNNFYDRYDRGYFPANSRTLTVVHRGQLQSPRLRDVALGQASLERLGRIQLQASQPDLRPSLGRRGEADAGALRTFSGENLRGVGRSFDSGQRRLSSQEIRTSGQRGIIREQQSAGAPSGSRSRTITNEDLDRFKAERGIRTQSSGQSLPSIQKKEGTELPAGTADRSRLRDSLGRTGTYESSREIRSFPSSGSLGAASSGLRGRSGDVATSRIQEFSAPSSGVRSPESRTANPERMIRERASQRQSGPVQNPQGSAIRERRSNTGSGTGAASGSTSRFESRLSSAPRSYSSPSSRTPREYGPSNSGGSSSLRNYGVPSRTYSTPSRSFDSSSRNFSAPSRSYNYSSPSRSYSAPSRSYSAPSRSYSAPSRTYSAPSRSYSSPSRSFSAPSRSYNYSSPSRSYSAPSRSYSAPSRSYSSPSRSYSSPSRSYSAPSRSSSGGSSRSSSSRSSSSGRARRR